MDNRRFRRLLFEVLDHDPTQADIRAFFERFKTLLQARGLSLKGITTDGSALYPEVLAQVFPGVRHQVCEFHVLMDITQAVLHALAAVRRRLKHALPRLPRGRPSQAQRAAARRVKRRQARIAELFEHRHLFVRRDLTPAQKKLLQRLVRLAPELHPLRRIMDEVYRLFDRRCRSATALRKLALLRRQVSGLPRLSPALKKLFSPTLEKALTFLDDRLLASTSNAVERGNRRHRKMQKSVYRVRTQQNLRCRIALDMQREDQTSLRSQTTFFLHQQRRETG